MLRIGLGVAFGVVALACAPTVKTERYVPTASEEWEGTWVNEHPKAGLPQKIVNTSTQFEDFWTISDPAPGRKGTHEIFKKWTDPEGNVWYQSYDVVGRFDDKAQSLHKVSKSGAALEFVVSNVNGFSPNSFPTQADLNPTNPKYHTYRRAEQ